jgi:hypothetical protein
MPSARKVFIMLNPGYVKNLLKMAMLIQYSSNRFKKILIGYYIHVTWQIDKAADAISLIQLHIEKFKLTKRVLISATIGESIFGNSCSLGGSGGPW